jgi:hypothetical protein
VPYGSGFGCRKSPDAWADDIKVALTQAQSQHLNWSELLDKLPALRYVLPADLRAILKRLREAYAIKALHDDDGYPAQIGHK